MKKILLYTCMFLGLSSYAQTWSGEVAQIFYDKCSKCHHQGGISSLSLTTYAEVTPIAAAIADYVSNDEMPPWPPDNDYQQYTHNRALSSSEKTTILDWISNDTPEGNASATPPLPVFPVGALLGAGDLQVRIPTYMSKAQPGADDYACFSIPSGLTQDRIIKSVEIIPGNRAIVHHALVYVDPTGVEVTDSTGGDCASPGNASTTLIAGYTPGSSPMTLPCVAPLKLGIPLPAGSNIYFGMHYPDGSYGQFDSTTVIFHFYPLGETDVRQVYAAPVIQNWNFVLPANQITPVTDTYGPLTTDVSLLSVFPHMHLLGKSIKTYGVTTAQDTLPLANLPEWDFHWQDFYFFKNCVYAPTGTTIKAEGVYDNTSANEENPNDPPVLVYPGLNTDDEMFIVYFHYMYHQAGDENYDMEALMSAALTEVATPEKSIISVVPNPSSDETTISFPAKKGDNLSVYIYDTQGNVVAKLLTNTTVATDQVQLNWDGTNSTGTMVHKGIYFVSINLNGMNHTQRIIRF